MKIKSPKIFGESTDWVEKLEKLKEIPIKKGAHGSLDPLHCLLFTGDWSNSFRGSIHCGVRDLERRWFFIFLNPA